MMTALSAPIEIGGHPVAPGASVGVACLPAVGSSVDDILAAADAALYEAKRRGRGRVACFEERLERDVHARAVLEGELRRGIVAEEFVLEFQPLVHLTTGNVSQAEALVRWEHPSRGLLRPDAFVPLAEEAGLVLPLGRWVLHEACRQAASWCGAGSRSGAAVSVNVSSVQLRDPGLVREVIGALHGSGLHPRQLTLELTESTALDDLDGTIAAMQRLQVLGVRFALDDFGTGHSSLGYLHRLPVDEVKIDRSFVASLATNRVASAVVQAVVTVATAVGVGVVAEGIESLGQLRAVRDLGCDVGQGYYLGRPRDTTGFLQFLGADGMAALCRI
jgi:predicted signal transduction protein with EAL and GGDEF domain